MENLENYVLTGAVSFLVGLALHSLRPRVKIVWWSSHSFAFNLTQHSVSLLTQAISIQNVGRKTAEFVEIVHEGTPDFFKLQPPLDYEDVTTPSGDHVIRIKSLGPREFFTIEFLSYIAVPKFLYIRSDAGHARAVTMMPVPVYPRWLRGLGLILFYVGLIYAVYWLLRVGAFLLRGVGVIS